MPRHAKLFRGGVKVEKRRTDLKFNAAVKAVALGLPLPENRFLLESLAVNALVEDRHANLDTHRVGAVRVRERRSDGAVVSFQAQSRKTSALCRFHLLFRRANARFTGLRIGTA